MRVLALLAAVAVAGCADGLVIGHMQTSDEWYQEGAWAALPSEGDIGGYSVETVFFSPGDEAGFAADDLTHWGAYRLQFVRWHDAADGSTFRTIQFEPDYVQVWLGVDLDAADARDLFMAIAPRVLEADREELERLADDLERSQTFVDPSPATEGSEARPARISFGAPTSRPDFEGLYASLGGLASFSNATTIGATGWLPVPGQVILTQGPWTFHLDTNLKRVVQGDDLEGDLLWVAPTDTLQYMHRDREALSDAAATDELARTLADVGLELPDRPWTFEHEVIRRELGD